VEGPGVGSPGTASGASFLNRPLGSRAPGYFRFFCFLDGI
jgi:hypothetical protein